jgi:hypothetical protein
MTDAPECGAAVPTSLRGDLKASRCRLRLNGQGQHVGDHKAHYTVPRAGKIIFRWPTQWKLKRAKQPPIVTLPAPTWGSKGKPPCECPPWHTGHGHVAPCRLT